MAALVALVAAGGPRGTDLPAAAAGDEGRLSGVVWLDDNGDGVRGTSETGIESHELRLKSLRTGTETSARTRADGAYEFTALAPGPYELTIDPKPGVRTASRAGFLTAPAIRLIGPLTTGLTISGATSARVDFGIYAARNEPGFLGSVWVNAAPAPPGAEVRAFVGNTECGFLDLFPTPMRPPSYYTLRIASDEVVPGCGKPGSVVTFRVNGRPANETAIWQPGETLPAGLSAAVGRFRPLNTLNLTAGPRFARFWGTVHGAGTSVTAESLIEAWIADTRCGVALAAGNFSTGPGAAVNPYLGVAVLPAELKPGCGREGAAVRFTIDGTQFGGEGAWRPGRRQVDLVVPPEPETPPGRIRAPDTGDAGLKRG